jgi:hypothetical protein
VSIVERPKRIFSDEDRTVDTRTGVEGRPKK